MSLPIIAPVDPANDSERWAEHANWKLREKQPHLVVINDRVSGKQSIAVTVDVSMTMHDFVRLVAAHFSLDADSVQLCFEDPNEPEDSVVFSVGKKDRPLYKTEVSTDDRCYAFLETRTPTGKCAGQRKRAKTTKA